MPVTIPLRLTTHTQKIASFYKLWLRHVEGHCRTREEYCFKAAVARAEFDCIMNEKDMRKSKQMLLDKQEEFKKFIVSPIYFPTQPEGTSYNRYPIHSDWMFDLWHPFEKAEYPEYFKKRELRKQQYIEMWEKQNQPPPPDGC